jgi:DNA processing protein
VLVVSGGALGVDVQAHTGAMNAGAATVAVLGSSLDMVFPIENTPVFDRIASSGGCVISEFKPGTRPAASTFPKRNRTVAGLCEAVVVVQGGPKSGALITAGAGFELSKKVFALMGNVDNQMTSAIIDLCRKGASVVTSPGDVLAAMGISSGSAAAGDMPVEPRDPGLDGDEGAVYRAMKPGCVHVDQITAGCALPPGRVSAILLELELRGIVRRLPGMLFERK